MADLRCCAYCGKPLVRRVWDCGRKETEKKFMARQFCDKRCRAKFQQKTYMESIEPKKCLQCGKEFIPTKHDDRIRFCSTVCQLEYRKQTGYMKKYTEENKERLKEKKQEYNPTRNKNRRSRYKEDENYREYAKRKAREYNERNPQKKLNQHLAKYGMTYDEYQEMYEKQGKKCVICGELGDESKPHRPLYIDHDHKTGKVRGLLCHRCNFMIGQARDDIEILQNGIEYLKKSKEGEN
jgi:hypothetical protein